MNDFTPENTTDFLSDLIDIGKLNDLPTMEESLYLIKYSDKEVKKIMSNDFAKIMFDLGKVTAGRFINDQLNKVIKKHFP